MLYSHWKLLGVRSDSDECQQWCDTYRKKMKEPHRRLGLTPRRLQGSQLPTSADAIGRLLVFVYYIICLLRYILFENNQIPNTSLLASFFLLFLETADMFCSVYYPSLIIRICFPLPSLLRLLLIHCHTDRESSSSPPSSYYSLSHWQRIRRRWRTAGNGKQNPMTIGTRITITYKT